MTLFERWDALLAQLHTAGRRRRLLKPCGVDFSSNDYLGFGKEMSDALVADRFPRSGMASRLLRGHHAIWEELEADLAQWHGAETALLFTSGYVANEGLLSALLEPHDWVASDQLNHASIIDGIRLSRADRFVFRHNDLNYLESGLQIAASTRARDRQLFVVTESLFGMEGDRAPLASLVELAQRYQAHLIVDEAHATGCFGPKGSGLVDEAGLRRQVLASVHTGGKALGLPGAYVCGPAMLREVMINRCRHFMFTTALPPAVGAWWLESLPRIQAADDRRHKLHQAAAQFRSELARHDLDAAGTDYIVPIVLGGEDHAVQAAAMLQRAGWDIRAIRPPTVPDGTSRLRLSLHADHEPDVLTAVAAAVADALGPVAARVP